MKISSLLIGLVLLVGPLSFGETPSSDAPKARIEQAARELTAKLTEGLHLILVQDDGTQSPFASAVMTIELPVGKSDIGRRMVSGESKIEISGCGVVDAARRQLLLDATIEAKVDFGGVRAVKGGAVGQFIVDRSEFKSERLPREVPQLMVLNSLAGGTSDRFSESAALLLVWK